MRKIGKKAASLILAAIALFTMAVPTFAATENYISNSSTTLVSNSVVGGSMNLVNYTQNTLGNFGNGSTANVIFNEDALIMDGSAVLGDVNIIAEKYNSINNFGGTDTMNIIENAKLTGISNSVIIGSFTDYSGIANKIMNR